MNRFAKLVALGLLASLLIAGRPMATTINVPLDYATIQAAINAASPGDIILLAAGTYEEQVEITKTITLEGGGADPGDCVILSPVTLTLYFLTNKPVVYIHDATGVTVRNLTVDGAGRGNLNYRFCGIAFWNAGGTVDRCVVKDITDSPFSGVQHGVGIFSHSSGTAAYAINVWDCEVYGFQKNGMALNAGDTNPLSVDVRRNVVTGAGATAVTAQNGIQIWADLGSGTVEDNVVSGIAYDNTLATTKWCATSILNYWADLDILGNNVSAGHMCVYNITGAGSISGNTIAVEKVGVYAYGICATDPADAKPAPFGEEISLATARSMLATGIVTLDVDVMDNVVTFSGSDNTDTYGIEADAGYDVGDLDITVEGNVVSGFDYGVVFWQCTSDCGAGVFTNVVAQRNTLESNTSYGMYSNASYIAVDGRYNWWGDASGPYHPTLNPDGLGTCVSDFVDFSPYLNEENTARVEPAYVLTNCSDARTVDFRIDQAGIPDEVRGYELKFWIDPAVALVTSITEGDFLKSVGTTIFYVMDDGGGAWTVSCAILGGSEGGAGSGSLFTADLSPAGEGVAAIDITSFKVRDLENNTLPSGALDGAIAVDCTPPTMDPIAEAEGKWYNAAPVFAHLGFYDDTNLDLAEYNYDGGTWATIFSGIDDSSWDSDPWTLPGFSSLSEESHTIYFRVKDDVGNWNTGVYSWQFYKDTTPPQPPTNFVAAPGHDKTHLSWTNPAGDATFVGVEIRFCAWPDYPHYDDAEPSYPADHSGGTYVALVSGASYDDNPRQPRDIYYYAAFSKDLAGNYSPLGTSTYDRCTSYWLGDVMPNPGFDGLVDLSDLAAFSGTFGVSEDGDGWYADCDFGPSDDNSRFGVPQPDNKVDFEDLMILAMNYHLVAPTGLYELAAAVRAVEDLGSLVTFELVSNGDGSVSIVLSNRASTLKGVRIVVAVEDGVLDRIERGSLFAGASELFFGLVPGDRNTVDISAAALGVDRPFARSGEVARLVIRNEGEALPRVRIAAIDLRDLDNTKTEIEVVEEYETPYVPQATALLQNFPNPFNPVTTITFDLTEAAHVRIDVFDVSGRLLATPVDAAKGAGRHRVEWNGRDTGGSLVPSGIYFYRMKTAGFDATRKMILVR